MNSGVIDILVSSDKAGHRQATRPDYRSTTLLPGALLRGGHSTTYVSFLVVETEAYRNKYPDLA